ncbi:hypothetical protein [Aeromicrobium sp.]|uniref:hypothetical protein n=1 Tax=Aeromicrobium sp. TaxID=1871063 RepID=UPI0028B04516|nr:hypothetical protein [Aeromicrobium sp.]
MLIDLSRLAARADVGAIRAAMPPVAALREQLDGGLVLNRPTEMLKSDQSHAYLAGVMWAVTEMLAARSDVLGPDGSGGLAATRKSRVVEAVKSELDERQSASPSELLKSERLSALGARPDEVSRALAELSLTGMVHEKPAERGQDRRRKYFALTGADT